jgi:hypothetical protein
VGEQVIGRGVQRDGVVKLDEDDFSEGGDSVGVEGQELIVPEEPAVRPEERERGREEEEQGE